MNPTTVLNEKVLVLNRLYTAVRVVSARRAFVMLFKQAAEVIAVENGHYLNYDFDSWLSIAELQKAYEPDAYSWIRTPRVDIAVPKIIRLLAYDRLPRQQVKLNRRNIYARDTNRCQYCGKHFPTRELTIDHVVPRVQGGEHTWRNLVCACVKCNTRKGGRTPRQARMQLIRRPVRPKRNPAITLRLGSAKYASWKAFLNDAYWTVELKD
ncbi:MAG: HNH endonuclease [Phycisphaerales bacterium]|nr:HNH endonuclease [Phycisphaerae bacterium]NNF44427.1 HNH endonuclease [Phycisphaerales bacterium]NNM24663.1 HNH endonuclease [Phycisphaerales bacterium]